MFLRLGSRKELKRSVKFFLFSVAKVIPDKTYLEILYFLKTGKKLNLKNPRTFDEKLQWLKLYDRKEEYVKLADKYEVKEYVAKLIGTEHVIPTLGVWKDVNEIDFERLPNRFVLKTTHDSGSVIICKDKASFDKNAAKEHLRRRLKQNYYYHAREWVYKNIIPRIIAEPYLEDESGGLIDYKLFCFHGEPYLIQVDVDRFESHRRNFYTLEWEYLNLRRKSANFDPKLVSRPKNLDMMIEFAKCLSANKPFVRVDFYEVQSHVFFGEVTFYPGAGFSGFEPEEWNKILGDMIDLERV